MKHAWLVPFALTTACLPTDASLHGKACDPTHACGQGLVCSSSEGVGTCLSPGEDGGLPNLLLNGGFETGTVGWKEGAGTLIDVQSSPVHDGKQSLRVREDTPSSDYVTVSLDRSVLQHLHSGQRYCVYAFVQRGTTTQALSMNVKGFDVNGNGQDLDPSSRVTPVTDDWQPLNASVVLAAPYDHGLNFRISTPTNGATGLSFRVDDVSLRETSPEAGCP